MNIKKKAFETIVSELEKMQREISGQLQSKKWAIKKIVEEQQVLKKKRAKLTEMINEIKGEVSD